MGSSTVFDLVAEFQWRSSCDRGNNAFEVTFDPPHQHIAVASQTRQSDDPPLVVGGRCQTPIRAPMTHVGVCHSLLDVQHVTVELKWDRHHNTVSHTMPLTWSPKARFHTCTLSGTTNIPRAEIPHHQTAFVHVIDMLMIL